MNTINRTLNYNHQIAFSADKVENKKSTAIAAVKISDTKDKLDVSASKSSLTQKKEGFNPVQGFNNFVSGCKKLWIGACEYTGATVKGAAVGALTFFGTGFVLMDLERRISKDGILKKFVKNPAHPQQWIERNAEKFFSRNDFSKNGFKFFAGAVLKPAKFILSHIPESKFNKALIAGALGVIPLATSLYNASLNVSEKTAAVDHRYNTGHRNEK